MDLKLTGFNVLVTGGAAGIGAAIVESFLKEGANVYFCSRSEASVANLQNTLKDLPGSCHGKALDIADCEGFTTWLAEIGKVDIYVPNAATFSGEWDVSAAVDIQANADNIEAVVPYLEKAANPAITYIGSIAALVAMNGMEVYSATKAAMTHYMKSLSQRLMAKGIRVNTVAPGEIFVEGGAWDRVKQNNPEMYKAALAANPMGRMGEPGEVANVVTFLSSPLASFVTGSVVVVDGGRTQHIQG